MKTIIQRNRREKEKFRVPHRVQDAIPVRAVYSDGLFLVGKDRFSKTFQFQDINYAVASQEDQRSMFMAYCSLLNSLDNNATVKITIHNRRMNLTTVRQDAGFPSRMTSWIITAVSTTRCLPLRSAARMPIVRTNM